MLLILGYLACAYLVFKGYEMLIAAAAAPDDSSGARTLGIIGFVAALITAIAFVYWLTAHSKATDSLIQSIP